MCCLPLDPSSLLQSGVWNLKFKSLAKLRERKTTCGQTLPKSWWIFWNPCKWLALPILALTGWKSTPVWGGPRGESKGWLGGGIDLSCPIWFKCIIISSPDSRIAFIVENVPECHKDGLGLAGGLQDGWEASAAASSVYLWQHGRWSVHFEGEPGKLKTLQNLKMKRWKRWSTLQRENRSLKWQMVNLKP